MSEEDHTKFGDSVFKALKAKTAKTQSSPLFRATVFPSRQSNKGREEDLCADTGCTKPIVGAEICREQKIHIQPLAGGMTITDASGNKLNIIGTAVFYIQSNQVLGNRKRRIKAAVLEGNEVDREILISLELLIEWDLVHPNFPNETLTYYFKRKLNKPKIKQCRTSYTSDR